jgi:hypothetical protein
MPLLLLLLLLLWRTLSYTVSVYMLSKLVLQQGLMGWLRQPSSSGIWSPLMPRASNTRCQEHGNAGPPTTHAADVVSDAVACAAARAAGAAPAGAAAAAVFMCSAIDAMFCSRAASKRSL